MSNYYPPVSFSFQVSMAGNRAAVDASFQEVRGLDAERPLTEVREGGENRYAHRLPGAVKYQNLQLKRGLMLAQSPIFVWCKGVLESDLTTPIMPKDLNVSLLDERAEPCMTWSVVRAWPVKWAISDFRAKESEIAIETIELAFQRVERKLNRTLKAEGFA